MKSTKGTADGTCESPPSHSPAVLLPREGERLAHRPVNTYHLRFSEEVNARAVANAVPSSNLNASGRPLLVVLILTIL